MFTDLFLTVSSSLSTVAFEKSLIASVFSISCLSILFFRSFGMMHEAVHGALHSRRGVNEVLGYIYGTLCFLPFQLWQKLHLDHHRWSGNFDKDPVMGVVRRYHDNPSLGFTESVLSFLWRAWVPVLATLQMIAFWKESFRLFKKEDRLKNGLALLPVLFWCALLTLAPLHFTAFVFAPALVIYLMLVEAINFPHHLSMEKAWGDQSFPLPEQYRTARTCHYPKWFTHFVLLNFNFHVEHHLFPNLPYRELPKAASLLENALESDYQSCSGFEWVRKNRQKPLRSVLLDESLTPGEIMPIPSASGMDS